MVIKEKCYIEPLQLDRMIHIYIPDNINSGEKLSVMYMFDGHNLFYDEDSTFGKSWGLKNFLDKIDAKIMIVGIECNHQGNERLSEFCPYTFNDKNLGYVEGKGKIFMEWIINSLKPYIDSKYPTIPDRENTGIGGSSMGGLMALYGIAMRSDIFSKGACLSVFYQHIYKYLLKDIFSVNLNNKTKVYISWGKGEFYTKKQLAVGTEKNLRISRIFTSMGIEVYPHLMVKGKHNEESWEKEIPIWLGELGLINNM